MKQIPLSRPDITELEKKIVCEVLDTPYLSMGPKTKAFEGEFVKYFGVKYAVAVSSGTAGLHVLVKIAGIKEGDEVMTSPFSFIASSNVILFEKAKPVFVDIDPKTLNIDANKTVEFIETNYEFDGQHLRNKETGAVLRALLPVHIFGHPVDMDPLLELSEKYNLPIIEDSCEAIGAEYFSKKLNRWVKVGTLGIGGVFAFYPNKQITTGEGGIIVTNSSEVERLARSLINQGRGDNPVWLEHVRLGYNYRMDELSAALGYAQMLRLDEILKKRQKVAEMYFEALSDIDEIELPYVAEWAKISWFVFVIKVKKHVDRDKLMEYLNSHGVSSKPYFTPIHLQKFYREMFGYKQGDLPVTEDISSRTIAIPFFNNLTQEEINYVREKLKEGIKKSKI